MDDDFDLGDFSVFTIQSYADHINEFVLNVSYPNINPKKKKSQVEEYLEYN